MNIKQKAKSRYDEVAEKYMKLYFDDHSDDEYIEKFLNHVQKNGRVLDIGCGPGRDLMTLKQKGFVPVGLDISAKMANLARDNNPGVQIFEMSADKLDFPDNSFDGGISMYTLIHLEPDDFQKAMREIYRVLKPNSPFLLVQHEGDIEGNLPDLMTNAKKTLYRYFVPLARLKLVLEQISFKIVYSHIQPFPESENDESTQDQLILIGVKE